MPTITDSMLKLLHRDGYSLGEAPVYYPNREILLYHVDASKDGERWVVTAPTRYEATVELMEQLGWDLMDG